MAMTDDEKAKHGFLNQYGLSCKRIFNRIDASLKKLDLSYVGLFQIHRFDPRTLVKGTVKALHGVGKSGEVRYIGASSMRAHRLLEYKHTTRGKGWTEFISIQNLYNAMYSEEE